MKRVTGSVLLCMSLHITDFGDEHVLLPLQTFEQHAGPQHSQHACPLSMYRPPFDDLPTLIPSPCASSTLSPDEARCAGDQHERAHALEVARAANREGGRGDRITPRVEDC